MDIQNELCRRFADCDDFVLRPIGKNGFAAYLKGLTDRDYISKQIIAPLTEAEGDFGGDFTSLLTAASVKPMPDIDALCDGLVRGETAVFFCGFGCMANAQDEEGRSVNEPQSDVTVKGPKCGFVEDAETNMALLRHYIRSDRLKLQSFNVGSESKTKVVLCYVAGRADERIVDMISNRLSSADPVSAIDSENLVPFLTGTHGFPFFPLLGSSEKVDKVASKLISGRVGIICDGSPFVLTAPYVFAESLQSAEDYLRTARYATFMRFLRFAALLTAVFLPAIFLCIKPGFDTLADLFVTLIIFELLREVGVRMPRTVGDSVGIVGSLIIGDAAVQAGLTSDESIICVALAAVCAFIVPVYMYAITLLRLSLLPLAFFFGYAGVAAGFALIASSLCAAESFLSPYMSPLAPFKLRGLADFLIALPTVVLGRKERP